MEMTNQKEPSIARVASSTEDVLGRVHLAPEVLEVIVGIATNEVEGVADTKGNLASGVAKRFGKAAYGKGVKTKSTENGLVIDVYCVIRHGFPVREVALAIQKKVQHAIFHMTSLETKEINIHITGIEFQDGTETN